jgi:heme/copper-type cytochrome/quinol oxidase subunit 3
MKSSVYGAIFYTLIGCHAIHVLGAVIWLLIVLMKLWQNRFTARKHAGIKLAGMYWFLVVALWPVLYTLVYLK